MATRQVLQNGTVANDGTGDTLRDAADKININFLSLWEQLGSSTNLSETIGFDSDGDLVFEGTSFTTTLTATEPTANNTVSLPDASGTVSLVEAVETLENKTLIHPVMDDIHDSDGSIMVDFVSLPNSTHYLTITQGDSATPVHLAIAPTDSADVDLLVSALNNGQVRMGGRVVYDNETISTNNATASVDALTTILDKSTAGFQMVLPAGKNIGDSKKFINVNSTTCQLNPSSLSVVGTAPALGQIEIPQNAACELIWSGTSWHIVSGSDVNII